MLGFSNSLSQKKKGRGELLCSLQQNPPTPPRKSSCALVKCEPTTFDKHMVLFICTLVEFKALYDGPETTEDKLTRKTRP